MVGVNELKFYTTYVSKPHIPRGGISEEGNSGNPFTTLGPSREENCYSLMYQCQAKDQDENQLFLRHMSSSEDASPSSSASVYSSYGSSTEHALLLSLFAYVRSSMLSLKS